MTLRLRAAGRGGAQLSRSKVPAHVIVVAAAELPLTASGKVRKFVLAERAAALLGLGAAA